MKKRFKQFIAGLSSAVMIAGTAGAMPTMSANAISFSNNSAFKYTVSVQKVSGYPNRVKVTFHVVNNPGFTILSFAIVDDDACTCVGHSTGVSGSAIDHNNDINRAFFAVSSSQIIDDSFNVNFIYDISGSTSVEHEFKIGIIRYVSPSEPNADPGIDLTDENSSNDEVPDNAYVEISPSVTVRIGDVDNDGNVDADDAYDVLRIVDMAPYNYISTVYLDGELERSNSSWSRAFPNLVCAAAADVNRTETIDQTDANDILQYYAHNSVGSEGANGYIGTLCPATIVRT